MSTVNKILCFFICSIFAASLPTRQTGPDLIQRQKSDPASSKWGTLTSCLTCEMVSAGPRGSSWLASLGAASFSALAATNVSCLARCSASCRRVSAVYQRGKQTPGGCPLGRRCVWSTQQSRSLARWLEAPSICVCALRRQSQVFHFAFIPSLFDACGSRPCPWGALHSVHKYSRALLSDPVDFERSSAAAIDRNCARYVREWSSCALIVTLALQLADDSLNEEKTVLMYRAMIGLGKYSTVKAEITEDASSDLQAVKRLASYLHRKADRAKAIEVRARSAASGAVDSEMNLRPNLFSGNPQPPG